MNMLDMIDKPLPAPHRSDYAIVGKEYFLKLMALRAVRQTFAPDGNEDALSRHSGNKLEFSTVADDLGTGSLFGGTRVVIVDDADSFVTEHRPKIEKLIEKTGHSGVLVLVLDALASNTRLFKMLTEDAVLRCEVDKKSFKSADWCRARCQNAYGKKLSPDAARIVAEQHDSDLGLLDQELAKLAASAPGVTIDATLAESLAGNGTQAVVWKVFDALAAGQVGRALEIMNDQYAFGGTVVENSMRLNGALAFHLRKIARAGRRMHAGMHPTQAMTEAGIRPGYPQQGAESLMRHLGVRRLLRLPEDLVTTDLALKGGSHIGQRTTLERLIVRLGRPRQ